MLSKKELKDIQSLTDKKNRDEAGLFVAEGPKIVSELLLLFPQQIQKIYAVPGWQPAGAASIPVERLTEGELKKISGLQTPNEVIAVISQQRSLRPSGGDFTLYLDTIQDPGNLGTIIRTCDWFGVQHIVCSAGCADRYNPKVVQSTMASIARVNVYYDTEKDWLDEQKGPVIAAALDGLPLSGFGKVGGGTLIIGNESKGISEAVMKRATRKLTIPRLGSAESLNAAVAAGIILSHLL
jgi:TrmH family RNA methyltransferase